MRGIHSIVLESSYDKTHADAATIVIRSFISCRTSFYNFLFFLGIDGTPIPVNRFDSLLCINCFKSQQQDIGSFGIAEYRNTSNTKKQVTPC